MLTDLRKRKLVHKFRVFDTDRNGYIEEADFRRVVERFRARSAEATARLAGQYDSFWTTLRRFADTDGDGRVDLQEWLTFHEAALDLEAAVTAERDHRPTDALTALVFDALDEDGDGVVSLDEYRRFSALYELDAAAADESFRRLDRNGDGLVSREELVEAAHEFHFSDDPDAAGNWLFGPF